MIVARLDGRRPPCCADLAAPPYAVHQCASSEQVLDTLTHGSIEVILTDLFLNDETGITLAGGMRQAGFHMPVMLLRGASYRMDAACAAVDMTPDIFACALAKPITPMALIAEIATRC